jgi:hypothetical protein
VLLPLLCRLFFALFCHRVSPSELAGSHRFYDRLDNWKYLRTYRHGSRFVKLIADQVFAVILVNRLNHSLIHSR